MSTQLNYLINRNFCIHQPRNAGFSHRMVGYISRQSCILRSLRQKFSDLVFSERSSTVPLRICRLSFVVYCQEERRLGSLHFFTTMAGELKIQMNLAVLVFGGVRFWIKSSAMAVSLPCFRSSFCFPHQDLLSSDRIIFYCNISPLKSPTLISCSKSEV